MRIAIAVFIFILSAGTALPQGRDSNDRSLGIEMNRDRAEGRINRLREDKRDTDKARAESKTGTSDRSKDTSQGQKTK
jgi:hypothetical protein